MFEQEEIKKNRARKVLVLTLRKLLANSSLVERKEISGLETSSRRKMKHFIKTSSPKKRTNLVTKIGEGRNLVKEKKEI